LFQGLFKFKTVKAVNKNADSDMNLVTIEALNSMTQKFFVMRQKQPTNKGYKWQIVLLDFAMFKIYGCFFISGFSEQKIYSSGSRSKGVIWGGGRPKTTFTFFSLSVFSCSLFLSSFKLQR
jgi:hypothetical protein